MLSFPWSFRRRVEAPPPLIFVTHAKGGSTWVDAILRALYHKQVAPRCYAPPAHFSFERHRIYSAIFITHDDFRKHDELLGLHRFLLIRDLRDTLVSNYFSVRDVHELDPAGVLAKRREKLLSLSVEAGLAFMIESEMEETAAIQRSWSTAEILTLKYEELIANDLPLLRDLLIGKFGHRISESHLRAAVEASRFENVFQRKIGVADAKSHGRQGAPGDWKNHLTPALRRQFHAKFGDILLATGYEKDAAWVTRL